jgi:hypothetical protein
MVPTGVAKETVINGIVSQYLIHLSIQESEEMIKWIRMITELSKNDIGALKTLANIWSCKTLALRTAQIENRVTPFTKAVTLVRKPNNP